MYSKLIKWWLTGILLFLPFQHTLIKIDILYNWGLSTLLHRIDIFTIVILFPLSLIEFYKNKEIIKRPLLVLLLSVLAIFFCGLISGAVNHNPLFPTIHGSIDYIKYFLVIFIYAAFFSKRDDFKKVFRLLLIIVTFIGAIAFVQEAWAMYSRHILNINIKDIFYFDIFNFLNKGTKVTYTANGWRFGIFRVASIMMNHIFLGLYCLLIFTIYSYTSKKMNFSVLVSLFSGLFFGVSRVVFASFILVAGLQTLRGRKWLLFFLIPVAVFFLAFIYVSESDVGTPAKSIEIPQNAERSGVESEAEAAENSVDNFFRKHTRDKAIAIWKDHVVFGVGPAMYGGGLSIQYNSPLYDYKLYEILPLATLYIKEWGTIDQFWPQLLAELGVVGIILFLWLFILLIIMILSFRNKAASPEMKSLFTGFIVYIFVILIYSAANSLNINAILYSYLALLGIASGYIIRT